MFAHTQSRTRVARPGYIGRIDEYVPTPGEMADRVGAGLQPGVKSVWSKTDFKPQVSNRGYLHPGGRDGRRPSQFRADRMPKGLFARKLYNDGYLDADSSRAFERQLIHLIQQTFRVEFSQLNARAVIPVYFAGDPGAVTVNWRQVSETGSAEIVSDWTQASPPAEVYGEEMTQRVRSLRAHVKWSLQELRQSQRAGWQLEQEKGNAARRALLRKENDIAWRGDAPTGLGGFLTDPALRKTPSPYDLLAPATTADEMSFTLHSLANQIVGDSGGVETPQTMALPIAQFNRCATTRIGTNGSLTVLQDFLVNSPYIDSVVRVREFAGAGAGGTDVASAFDRSLDKLRLNVLMDMEAFPPDNANGVTTITFHMRTGGVTWHKPGSALVYEGI